MNVLTPPFPPPRSGQYDLVFAPDLAPTPEWRLTAARRLAVGERVMLALDYATCGDAAQGPLRPRLPGTVVEDDRTSKPFRVATRVRGPGGVEREKSWWYDADVSRSSIVSYIFAGRNGFALGVKGTGYYYVMSICGGCTTFRGEMKDPLYEGSLLGSPPPDTLHHPIMRRPWCPIRSPRTT